jgi:hypothetical protein
MLEARADGELGQQRKRLYTYVPTTVLRDVGGDDPYFCLNMDTWYFSEWADPNHSATLGTMALGDGPLTAAQDVVAFVAQQILAFRAAFSGLFRPMIVTVGFKPRLTGVRHISHAFSVPETPEDVQALQATLEQSTYERLTSFSGGFAGLRTQEEVEALQTTPEQPAYEGITGFIVGFALQATVRDEHGQLAQVWIPKAGSANYHARYTAGSVSNRPRSVAVTYLLTPSAQAGIAPWTVDLDCNFLSLFRATNAEVLARVRERWQHWLEAHPSGTADVPDDEDDESEQGEGASDEWEVEDHIVTLAQPPLGTPPDNQDLYKRNTPLLRTAVRRWEEKLGAPFEWAVDL